MIDGHRQAVVPDDASETQQVVDADEAVLVIRDNRQTRVSLFDPFDIDLDAWTIPAARR